MKRKPNITPFSCKKDCPWFALILGEAFKHKFLTV
jgi:hypothetical protein